MSRNIKRARESWLNDGDDDHAADCALLCMLAHPCEERCALEGFCFRGITSPEVRASIEARLTRIERDIAELRWFTFDQLRDRALTRTQDDATAIRDNILPFAPVRGKSA
ncbi:MAG: hypothetical protein JWL61_4976 [Gemmatimonadetes bacterium]|nr:hypothetical protein [Gemmatimonadota bacterium]